MPRPEIALSFDDAPTTHAGLLAPAERTRCLIAGLKSAGVKQAVLFCNSSKLTPSGRRRLLDYQRAGHLIANHGHRHLDLHRVGEAAFISDLQLAHRQLSSFTSFRRWFRFPMLHEGKSKQQRDAVRQALRKMGYINGYVTVDNYDWYLDLLARKAFSAGHKVDSQRLKKLYLDSMLGCITFYDRIARTALKRTPRHVLLLHENDLAARYIVDLVRHLRRAGWRIVSPELAYRDPIASINPDTLLLGQGRVAAIARAGGYTGSLWHPSESRRWWDRMFRPLLTRR